MRQARLRILNIFRKTGDFLVGLLVLAIFTFIRALPTHFAIRLGGRAARALGHLVPRSHVALRQIAAAFPEKSRSEQKAILQECWDNLGRTCIEYCHLDCIWNYNPDNPRHGNIEITGLKNFEKMRSDGKPAIIVTAHLANWELPMVAASAHGLNAAALYRAPNNKWVAKWVLERRKVAMGRLIASKRGSIHALSNVLGQGEHLGILTDQYFWHGVKSILFGREVLCNPVFARLARLHDCPVFAVRVIRLEKGRFKVELTDELNLPRDMTGKVEVQGSVDLVNRLFEGWITEYPGQWLWLHRRWR